MILSYMLSMSIRIETSVCSLLAVSSSISSWVDLCKSSNICLMLSTISVLSISTPFKSPSISAISLSVLSSISWWVPSLSCFYFFITPWIFGMSSCRVLQRLTILLVCCCSSSAIACLQMLTPSSTEPSRQLSDYCLDFTWLVIAFFIFSLILATVSEDFPLYLEFSTYSSLTSFSTLDNSRSNSENTLESQDSWAVNSSSRRSRRRMRSESLWGLAAVLGDLESLSFSMRISVLEDLNRLPFYITINYRYRVNSKRNYTLMQAVEKGESNTLQPPIPSD